MSYQIFKSLHFIGIISWFAGLFYIVRLFIYHVEALDRPSPDREVLTSQFKIMERRLWFGITWPACILTWLAGIGLATTSGQYVLPWFHIKLLFLICLQAYHFKCGSMVKSLKNDLCSFNSYGLRLFNELATLLMVIIVFLAVYKQLMNVVYAIVGFAIFGILLILGIKLYRSRLHTHQ